MDPTNEIGKKRRRRSCTEIAAVVAGYRPSGLTQRAYALQVGVSLASLTRWLHRGSAARPASFATVQVQPEQAVGSAVKIRWPEGMEVELPLSLGEVTLRRWLGEFLAPCSR
jgi:hypothetical protein